MKTSNLHKEAIPLILGKTVQIGLIDLTVIYFVLNENCSHPAQAISDLICCMDPWLPLQFHQSPVADRNG